MVKKSLRGGVGLCCNDLKKVVWFGVLLSWKPFTLFWPITIITYYNSKFQSCLFFSFSFISFFLKISFFVLFFFFLFISCLIYSEYYLIWGFQKDSWKVTLLWFCAKVVIFFFRFCLGGLFYLVGLFNLWFLKWLWRKLEEIWVVKGKTMIIFQLVWGFLLLMMTQFVWSCWMDCLGNASITVFMFFFSVFLLKDFIFLVYQFGLVGKVSELIQFDAICNFCCLGSCFLFHSEKKSELCSDLDFYKEKFRSSTPRKQRFRICFS